MKKWNLIASIVQLTVGVLAIAAFAVIGFSTESVTKWIITLVLAVIFVVLGIIGIADHKKKGTVKEQTKASFVWKSTPVPEGMEIRQVYGILFSKDGRVLLKVEEKLGAQSFSFAGGHPERFDNDMAQTLVREVREEINSSISAPVYIGFQEVDEGDGEPPYAQVRMAALLDTVGEILPDPDNGETYKRLLVPPSRAAELLGWGKIANEQIEDAVLKMGINLSSYEEEYI